MKVVDSLLELIDNTPMLRLHKVTEGIGANVLVKLEYLNPSGSYKDRMALRMIEDAEKTGLLKPRYTIVESSSGNTAIALAMVGSVKGYKVRIFYPQEVWQEEKKKTLYVLVQRLKWYHWSRRMLHGRQAFMERPSMRHNKGNCQFGSTS